MDLRITSEGDDHALEQFYHWLRSDTDVVRSAQISTGRSQDAGHMGAFEVISMSIGSLTGLASLGIAWANFLRSRKDTPPLTLNVIGPLSDEQLEELKRLNLPLAPDSASTET